MKKIFFSIIGLAISYITFAQTPQSFQYQAVVRDVNGVALINQPVDFQLSIISGSPTGTVEYVETHTGFSTNAYGIVTLSVGGGTLVSGSFTAINWGSALYFLKVEADLGTGLLDMGTTQLLSVPYALYAETAGNAGQTYTAGNGISITGNVIDNTAPDQTVVINSGTGTNVSGTYPNFTIDNAQPDQTVTIAQGGATTVTGTYPNFTINSTDANTTYSAGTGIDVTGTTITNTAPDQTVTITNGTGVAITGTYPSFTITNSSPNATHTGDVTGSGALTIANNAVTTTKIADGNVTAVKLNSMAATNGQVLKYNGTNWAPAADANTTYTAGSGINVAGTVISNTAPDQTVAITGSGATSVTGTYPNFTISSTDTNTTYSAGTGLNLTGTTFSSTQTLAQTLANGNTAGTYNILMNNNDITGARILGLGSSNANYIDMYYGHIYDYDGSHGNNGEVLTVHGTSPNTWVTWDVPASYTFGNGLSLTGNTVNSVWSTNGNHIYNNNTGNVGVGLNNPLGKMVVQGDTLTSDTIPLFEVKDKLGHTVFVVYPDSVHIYVKDTGAKSNKGGFAISGKNMSKALTHDFLYVDPDFTRVYTGDTTAGFGVQNIGVGTSISYMHLTPNNYLIGHESGININIVGGGLYNSYFGYQSGKFTTIGNSNVANGYQAMYNNITGSFNVANGYQALYHNTSGGNNVAVGDLALFNNTTGGSNQVIGINAMYLNTTGSENIAIGTSALSSNTNQVYNVAIGNSSMYYGIGNQNVAIGMWTLYRNTRDYNTAVGMGAFYSNSATSYTNSTAIGYASAITASNQVRLGNSSITTLFCKGAYAATTASAANMYVSAAGQIMRSTSSKRYKKDIVNLTINTEDIYKLRPVSYISIMDDKPYFGLIAEEVAEVIPGLAEFAKEKDVIKGSDSEN